MLVIVTPAQTYDLVTLAAVKTALRIDCAAEDARLAAWISQASGAIAQSCNCVFAAELVEETFRPGRRAPELMLARTPVLEVASIIENGTAIDSSDYELDAATGSLTRLFLDSRSWWSCSKIVVRYRAGYDIADVPSDLQRAAFRLVEYYREAPDPLLRSIQVENVSSRSYQDWTPGEALPPEVVGLIASRRKPCVG